ncbi:MAG TPA: hypothetical protein VK718_01060 [Ferruginibacter sp.]|jgi:hypothetical protein|nr:hypothetical protein [Ferruginibacter sp.]
MIPQEKIDSFRKDLRRGLPDGELRRQLEEEGYSKEDIAKVFEPRKYDMGYWYLVSGIVVLIVGLYLSSLTIVTRIYILFFTVNINTAGHIFILLSGLLFYEQYKLTNKKTGSES